MMNLRMNRDLSVMMTISCRAPHRVQIVLQSCHHGLRLAAWPFPRQRKEHWELQLNGQTNTASAFGQTAPTHIEKRSQI